MLKKYAIILFVLVFSSLALAHGAQSGGLGGGSTGAIKAYKEALLKAKAIKKEKASESLNKI